MICCPLFVQQLVNFLHTALLRPASLKPTVFWLDRGITPPPLWSLHTNTALKLHSLISCSDGPPAVLFDSVVHVSMSSDISNMLIIWGWDFRLVSYTLCELSTQNRKSVRALTRPQARHEVTVVKEVILKTWSSSAAPIISDNTQTDGYYQTVRMKYSKCSVFKPWKLHFHILTLFPQ